MRKIIIFMIAVTLLLIFSGCDSKEPNTSTETKTESSDTDQAISAFGVVKGTQIKNITITFPAIIEKINVKEGQRVNKGDSLVTLDIREYKAEIKKKEIEQKKSQDEVEKIKSTYVDTSTNPELKKLLSDLADAQTQYQKALEELNTKQLLYADGGLSKYDFEEFQKSVELKKKAVDDMKYAIETMKFNKKLEVDPKSANVYILNSELDIMKDKLNASFLKENEIISDIPKGVVYEIGYTPGDIVNAEKKILSIINLDDLIVDAEIREEDVKNVKIGADAVIIPIADKTRQYAGKVVRIANKAFQKSGETVVPVEISIVSKDDFLIPEFNVDVKITP